MTNNFNNTPARARGARLAAGTTKIYTANTYAQMVDLRCANVSSGAATVTVEWFSSKNNQTYRLINQGAIPVNEARHYALDAFALEPQDEIRLTPGTANSVDAIITFLEIPGRSG